jgi:transposase
MPMPQVAEQSVLVDVEPVVAAPKAPVDKTFRRYDQDQPLLLPPDLRDWLPADHPARMVDDLVEHGLDLGGVYAGYTEVRGAPAYDPRLMLKVLIYGYSHGVTSSRALERRCHDDIAFRFLTADAAPDFVAISRFRVRHGSALKEMFTQSLALCARAGLVTLGRVALDGSKVRASASRHKAMSYGRMVKAEPELAAEVDALVAQAEAIDAAEDAAYGDRRGDELPAELARREGRLAKIRAARAALEAEHADAARAKAQAKAAKAQARAQARTLPAAPPENTEPVHTEPVEAERVEAERVEAERVEVERVEAEIAAAGQTAAEAATVPDRAQRSFTDPDARIMKTSDSSFHYCYNGQAVVDEGHQVILAAELTQCAADAGALAPMLDTLSETLAAAGIATLPATLLADAGYFCEDNVAATLAAGIDPVFATGRLRHGEAIPAAPRGRIPASATPKQRMARKARTKKGKADYARRKAIVEPVFGQIQTCQDGGRLRLRGKTKTDIEWHLHLACHNLRKLFGSGQLSAVLSPG